MNDGARGRSRMSGRVVMSDRSNHRATPRTLGRRNPRGAAFSVAARCAPIGACAASQAAGGRAGPSRLSGLFSFVLIGAFSAWACSPGRFEARKPGPLTADKVVLIEREDDSGPIADQLERAGVIDSALLFSAMTWSTAIAAGSSAANTRSRQASACATSRANWSPARWCCIRITIPEGLTSDQVVQRLRDNDVFVGDIKEMPREGSLLPETYKFARGETRTGAARQDGAGAGQGGRRNLEEARARSADQVAGRTGDAGFDRREGDRQGRRAPARRRRVHQSPAKADEARIRPDDRLRPGVRQRNAGPCDLQDRARQATPYNTYIIAGLPPGPISNPGKAALEAVANPRHTKDLYLRRGRHRRPRLRRYARTASEECRALARDRKGRQGSARARRRAARHRAARDAGHSALARSRRVRALAPMSPSAPMRRTDPSSQGRAPIRRTRRPSAARRPPRRRPRSAGACWRALAKLGASLQKRAALLGAGGALARPSAGKSSRISASS